jgi:uncharacterized RDD family membrane protein YckC
MATGSFAWLVGRNRAREILRVMASKDDELRSGLADAAGRAAFFPARAAARAWRGSIEDAVDEVLSAPEISRLVDRALAGQLPEELARSLADRVLASDETQHALRHVASSPELRDAVARQTTGFAEELVGGVRASAARLDDRAEQVVRRPSRPAPPIYGGIVTRALALATDAALTIVIFMSVVGVAALVASLVGGLRPAWLAAALLASGWTLIVGTYFVLCWSATGQTPGMRLLRLRLRGPEGGSLSIARSLVRFAGLILAIVPMFAGFVPVLFTQRRRGLPDYLAGTVVLYDDTHA